MENRSPDIIQMVNGWLLEIVSAQWPWLFLVNSVPLISGNQRRLIATALRRNQCLLSRGFTFEWDITMVSLPSIHPRLPHTSNPPPCFVTRQTVVECATSCPPWSSLRRYWISTCRATVDAWLEVSLLRYFSLHWTTSISRKKYSAALSSSFIFYEYIRFILYFIHQLLFDY